MIKESGICSCSTLPELLAASSSAATSSSINLLNTVLDNGISASFKLLPTKSSILCLSTLSTCALQNTISPSTVITMTKSGNRDNIRAFCHNHASVCFISSTNAFLHAQEVQADLRQAMHLEVHFSLRQHASARRKKRNVKHKEEESITYPIAPISIFACCAK